MIAVTLGVPFWRALRHAVLLLITAAVIVVPLSMAQRLAMGGQPGFDQLRNFVSFFQLAALQL